MNGQLFLMLLLPGEKQTQPKRAVNTAFHQVRPDSILYPNPRLGPGSQLQGRPQSPATGLQAVPEAS